MVTFAWDRQSWTAGRSAVRTSAADAERLAFKSPLLAWFRLTCCQSLWGKKQPRESSLNADSQDIKEEHCLGFCAFSPVLCLLTDKTC